MGRWKFWPQSYDLRGASEGNSAAHRLATHLVFGSWSFFGFWSLVFGVSAKVSRTLNHTPKKGVIWASAYLDLFPPPQIRVDPLTERFTLRFYQPVRLKTTTCFIYG
jgi:hypothetical protein